jgi:hypothetical protein
MFSKQMQFFLSQFTLSQSTGFPARLPPLSTCPRAPYRANDPRNMLTTPFPYLYSRRTPDPVSSETVRGAFGFSLCLHLILSSFKALNMSTFVVTESNRGIGLAITTQLAALPSTSLVIASAHTPEKAVELNALANASAGKIVVVKMDTSSLESMKVSFLSLLVEGGGR